MRSSDQDGLSPATQLEGPSPQETGGITALDRTRQGEEFARMHEGRRLAARIDRLNVELLAFGIQPHTVASLRHLARLLRQGRTPLLGIYVIARHNEDQT